MRGDEVGTYINSTWCWLPWRSGSMTVAEAKKYAGTRARCLLAAKADCQGEVDLGNGKWLRLYGGSIKGGSERDPTHKTATLEVIEGRTITKTLDLDGLARDKNALPVGGRYEPEGLAQAVIKREPYVLAGFSVGRLGNTTMTVFGRPLRYVLTS